MTVQAENKNNVLVKPSDIALTAKKTLEKLIPSMAKPSLDAAKQSVKMVKSPPAGQAADKKEVPKTANEFDEFLAEKGLGKPDQFVDEDAQQEIRNAIYQLEPANSAVKNSTLGFIAHLTDENNLPFSFETYHSTYRHKILAALELFHYGVIPLDTKSEATKCRLIDALLRAICNAPSLSEDAITKAIGSGAEPAAIDSTKRNALHIAVQAENIAATEILLRYYKERLCNSADQDGMTPVAIACKIFDANSQFIFNENKLEITKKLIENRCGSERFKEEVKAIRVDLLKIEKQFKSLIENNKTKPIDQTDEFLYSSKQGVDELNEQLTLITRLAQTLKLPTLTVV